MSEAILKLTLKKLLACSELAKIAPRMVTKDGFDSNIDELEKIIALNLKNGERLTLVYSDGRLFFDSAYVRRLHNGVHVFQSDELKDASINGSQTELPQLAIENHMSRPEVFSASQHPSFVSSSKRVSSTVSSGGIAMSTYVAQAATSGPGLFAIIRLSMTSLIEEEKEEEEKLVSQQKKFEKLVVPDFSLPEKPKPVARAPRTRTQKVSDV